MSGIVHGTVDWIKFGYGGSKFTKDGQRIAGDKKGKTVGHLTLVPNVYNHTEDLDLDENYQIKVQLTNNEGEEQARTILDPSNPDDNQDPRTIEWKTVKGRISLHDTTQDTVLKFQVVSAQVGKTGGLEIASGTLDIEACQLYTQPTKDGLYIKKLRVQMLIPGQDNVDEAAEDQASLTF